MRLHFIAHIALDAHAAKSNHRQNAGEVKADRFLEMVRGIGREPGMAGLERTACVEFVAGGLDFATDRH